MVHEQQRHGLPAVPFAPCLELPGWNLEVSHGERKHEAAYLNNDYEESTVTEAPKTKAVAKWADEYMFEAEKIDASKGPEVFLVGCNNDPLGSIAKAAKAYKGEFVTSLAEITDEERRYYLGEVRKTALEMPLESVNFDFLFRGVTRGFTHQLVRQRTAAYSQESTRFAVKDTVPVGLPPSLVGSKSYEEWQASERLQNPEMVNFREESLNPVGLQWKKHFDKYASQKDRWRFKWDKMMEAVAVGYNELVNDGMPAEDARGSLPTNLLTQVNYYTNLRGLKGHSGMRLCTQAQYEWKLVWAGIVQAIREYGKGQTYWVKMDKKNPLASGTRTRNGHMEQEMSAQWQFDELANIFRPDCYYAGKCTFKADFDRKCTIRDRVDANASINRPSTEWDQVYGGGEGQKFNLGGAVHLGIPAIHPAEWLMDPSAAR